MGVELARLVLAGAAGGGAGALTFYWLALRGRPPGTPPAGPVALGVTGGGLALGAALAPGAGNAWGASASGALVALVLWAAAVDLRDRVIPNALTYPGILLGLVLAPLTLQRSWTATLLGAGFMLALYLPVALVRPRWLGMGDVKLALVLGLFLGFPLALVAALGAALVGAGAALRLVLRGEGRAAALPYGPCLAAGGLAALVVGQTVPAYSRLLG